LRTLAFDKHSSFKKLRDIFSGTTRHKTQSTRWVGCVFAVMERLKQRPPEEVIGMAALRRRGWMQEHPLILKSPLRIARPASFGASARL